VHRGYSRHCRDKSRKGNHPVLSEGTAWALERSDRPAPADIPCCAYLVGGFGVSASSEKEADHLCVTLVGGIPQGIPPRLLQGTLHSVWTRGNPPTSTCERPQLLIEDVRAPHLPSRIQGFVFQRAWRAHAWVIHTTGPVISTQGGVSSERCCAHSVCSPR
jgi:hypothetical protein